MRHLGALVFLAGLASIGAAQVPPRVAVQLRGFGNAPVAGSQLQVLAGQLELEVQNLRNACRTMNLPPGLRLQVGLTADRSFQVVQQFRQLTYRNASPADVLAAHAGVDQSLTQLAALVEGYAAGSPAVAQALNRAQFADDRLHTLLGGATPGGDVQRQLIVRLAASLEDTVGELRAVIDDSLPAGFDRTLSRQLRQVSGASRRVAQLAGSGAAAPVVTAEVGQLVSGWQAVTPQVALVAGQSPRVRLQAAQVDQLMAELARTAGGGVAVPDPGFGIVTPSSRVFVVGAGESGGPRVRIFHELNGPSTDFFAYDPNYRGGVRVAIADLNGDGFPDIVTAPGRDTQPLIRVFDGRTLGLLTQFVAYDPPYDLGTFVAAADITRDGRAVVAVGPGPGGPPHVKLFDIAAGKLLDEIFPYGKELRCGARVALADVDGDGTADLITAPGPDPGIGPQVKVFNGRNGKLLREFNAFDERWRGGLHVAAADVTRNGRAELIVGTDAGGPASVRVFDPFAGRLLAEWQPYGNQFRGGVRVAAFDVNNDGVPDIVAAPGTGSVNVPIRAYDGRTRRPLGEFVPFEGGFAGGAFIGGK